MASSSNQFAFVALNLADKFYTLSRNLGGLRGECIGNFPRICLPRGAFGAINVSLWDGCNPAPSGETRFVRPANAGIKVVFGPIQNRLDSGFRRKDGIRVGF